MSVEFILKRKRIIYLHHLLSSEDENLAKQVLVQQILTPIKSDFVKSDLEDFKLHLDFDQISQISKRNFKKMVKKAGEYAYLATLINNKKSLSQGKHLDYKELKLQSHLKPNFNLTSENMKRIMKIRL